MKTFKVINIQRFSIHDGDGIRTTIFFKGCNLSCWWCHNPESQRYVSELLFDKERCVGCGACSARCPSHAVAVKEGRACTDTNKCDLCGECLDYCISSAREIAGKAYTVAELVNEVEKDRMFYEESMGGVTLSGGEVMTQDIELLVQLVKKLKRRGYHIAVDTCGYAPPENYLKIMPYVDVFLYDIKIVDDTVHEKFMGKSNRLILNNLIAISEGVAKINIRIPLIVGVNTDDKSIDDIIDFLKKNVRASQINLLPYHNMGSTKYSRLGLEYKGNDFATPDINQIARITKKFNENGFYNVKNGG